MKKMMESFGNQALSRCEMKSVVGGGTYSCSCSRHAGSWTGRYADQSAANASLSTYCRGGGNCNIQ